MFVGEIVFKYEMLLFQYEFRNIDFEIRIRGGHTTLTRSFVKYERTEVVKYRGKILDPPLPDRTTGCHRRSFKSEICCVYL
jgi:hypothetical protein